MRKRPTATTWTAAMRNRMPADMLDYFRAQGAKGGAIGGKRAAANMTAAARKARATKASKAAAVARSKKKHAKARS
jgi:uncharacterized protein YdaU (DUF1376 family)